MMNQFGKLRIIEVNLANAGVYNQQYARPYAMMLNADNIEPLLQAYDLAKESHIARIARREIHPETMADIDLTKVVGNIVRMDTAGIPVKHPFHDWETEVASFVIEAEYVFQNLSPTLMYITGFTDRPVPLDGTPLDPEMNMFVNSIFTGRTYQEMTPEGLKETIKLVSADQVLTNVEFIGIDSADSKIRIRPQDVLGAVAVARLESNFNNDMQIVDTRYLQTNTPSLSRYANNNPSLWLEEIVKADIFGQERASQQNRYHSANDIATRCASENSIQRNPFIRAVSQMIGASSATSQFTLATLRALNPEAFRCYPTRRRSPEKDVEYASWDGQDQATIAATTVVQGITALMGKYGVRSISLESNNVDNPGQLHFKVLGTAGVFDFVDDDTLAQLMEDIQTHVLNGVTFNNAMAYNLKGDFDLFGSSLFTLSINFDEAKHYASPTFASALFSPVLAPDKTYIEEIAANLENILQS